MNPTISRTQLIVFTVILIVIGGALIVLSIPNQTTSSGANNQSEKIEVGYLPITASLPLFVAIEKEYFKEQGLTVETTRFEVAKPITDAMLLGKIDGTGAMPFTILLPIELKEPGTYKIIEVSGETKDEYASYLIVRDPKNIQTPKDLKGKKLLTGPGSASKAIVDLLLRGFGLTVSDVNLIQVEHALVPSTFIQGNADAVFIWEPFATVILHEKAGVVLLEGARPRFILNPYPATVHVISSAFIREHPEDAKRYVIAMQKATEFIHSHPTEAKTLLSKYVGIPPKIAQESRLYRSWEVNDINKDNLQQLIELMIETHQLEKPVDVTQIIYQNN